MAIPGFQEFMLPLLRRASDGADHRLRDLREQVADDLGLDETDRAEMLGSGNQARYANRFYWAAIHLNRAKLSESPSRGLFRITPRGRDMLARGVNRVDLRLLNEFPEFREFRQSKGEAPTAAVENVPDLVQQTPQELLDKAYAELRAAVGAELLQKLKDGTPSFFERVVVDVMQAMGYGAFSPDAGIVVGSPGDGGIDGIIHLDKLGLETIYLQAKRWEGSVGRPDVQKFSGSLDGVRAKKGVMVTTSSFASGALEYVKGIDKRIVLIDGDRLVNLMIDHGIGVTEYRKVTLVKVDSDYFED